ncbi:MAG: DUF1028 domain-containing protein [Proteobacteria bacterium]|nr:DUF1028 domain-containing protein [Pseudomonadota bacterium]
MSVKIRIAGERLSAPILLATVLLVPCSVSATWSVAAVDPQTSEVGVAGASCVDGVEIIGGVAPGKGAVASQSAVNTAARIRAVKRLNDGAEPSKIITEITRFSYDPAAGLRQYGISALDFDPAGFTGNLCTTWAGHKAGAHVSVQGNMLYGAKVVDDALAAFEADHECPFTLADRLMAAMEAGSAQGGDNRCSKQQSALSSFIMVARPGDSSNSPYLKIIIPEQQTGGENPVTLLRAKYDQWRKDNPPDDSTCDTDIDADTDSDSDGDTDSDSDSDSDINSDTDTDTESEDDTNDNNGDDTDGNGNDDRDISADKNEDSCGCSTPGSAKSIGLFELFKIAAQ